MKGNTEFERPRCDVCPVVGGALKPTKFQQLKKRGGRVAPWQKGKGKKPSKKSNSPPTVNTGAPPALPSGLGLLPHSLPASSISLKSERVTTQSNAPPPSQESLSQSEASSNGAVTLPGFCVPVDDEGLGDDDQDKPLDDGVEKVRALQIPRRR